VNEANLVSKIDDHDDAKSPLPEVWEATTLGAIARIEMGQSPPSDTYNNSGHGLPFFQGKAEFGGWYPEIRKYCSVPKKVAPAGAILISVRAPVGPTNLAPEECCIGRGLAAIEPIQGVDTYFLLYFFRAIEPALSTEGTGSTFSAINGEHLRNLKIQVPPYQEQRRIVAKIEELFSELDDSVANLETARARLQTYRKSLLKHAFEGRLTEQWRREHADELESADQLLERIREERQARYQQQLEEWKAQVAQWEAEGKPGKKPRKPAAMKAQKPIYFEDTSRLPELPRGWIWVRVGDLLLVPPHNGRSVKDRDGGFPVLRLTAMKEGGIDLGEFKFGDWEEEEAKDYIVSYGDFLVMRGNGSKHLVGSGGAVGSISRAVAFPDTMIRLRLVTSGVDPKFFGHVWNSRVIRNQIEAAARTTAGIYKINQQHIQNLIFPLPPLEEQKELGRLVEENANSVEPLENTVVTSIQREQVLRQSILKCAFEGRLETPA